MKYLVTQSKTIPVFKCFEIILNPINNATCSQSYKENCSSFKIKKIIYKHKKKKIQHQDKIRLHLFI